MFMCNRNIVTYVSFFHQYYTSLYVQLFLVCGSVDSSLPFDLVMVIALMSHEQHKACKSVDILQ